jgi:hypothetical protein
MLDDRNRYWPRQFEEMANDRTPVSWLNEPVPPDNVIPLPKPAHSLHAVLCEALISNRGLLQRLELGVTAPPGEARVAVRDLFVQLRRTTQALSRCLELPDLE